MLLQWFRGYNQSVNVSQDILGDDAMPSVISSSSSSDSSSSSSDDELLHRQEKVRIKNFMETVQAYSDEEFRKHFRLERQTAETLIGKYYKVF